MTVQIVHGPIVEAPTPEKVEGGLLDVAEVHEGIAWHDPASGFLSWNCLDVRQAPDLCDTTPDPATKTFDGPTSVTGHRFNAYLAGQCKPLNMMSEVRENISRVFDLRETMIVETNFYADVLNAAADAGTVTNALDALALLEGKMGQDYAGKPVIHVSPGIATILLADKAIVEEGGKFYTRLGSKVVIGRGYGPGIWATGEVTLYRGPKEVVEVPDTTNNAAQVLAERMYVAYADCVAYEATITPE